jgi:hypothetical protein
MHTETNMLMLPYNNENLKSAGAVSITLHAVRLLQINFYEIMSLSSVLST